MGRGHPPPSPTLPFSLGRGGGRGRAELQPRRSGRAGPGKGGSGGSSLHGRRRRQERQAWPARRPAQTEGHAVAARCLTGEEEPARGSLPTGAKGRTASP